ncbi:MAG: acetyl-CoA C-acetyltransferase [bacterium]|nr:acetyl-CoA C-acetyltransferase [bacterium]
MKNAVIVSAVRTPIGRFRGTLSGIPATQLGAQVVREAVQRSGIESGRVDEVIMGNVVGAGLGQNPARQAALGSGLPDSVPALTINKVCGSGLKAVVLASQAIRCGDANVVIAGGMESMSNAPYLLRGARDGMRMGHGKVLDSMIHDGLWDAYNDYHMGNTGEVVAERYEVDRAAQDQWAFESHQKAIAAIDDGKFKNEITPVEVPQRKKDPVLFDTDECPRRDTSLEALGKLRPAFKKDGTVTAGNAPPVNDGASALVVMSPDTAQELGCKPLAEIVAYASSGLAPELVMMAPELAVRSVWEKTGWSADDVDLYEFNEAFSVQQVALGKVLGIDPAKHNVSGGAVALGHPIGASGARILTTLVHALEDRNAQRGIAALCLGGGNAVAMAVQRV